MSLCETHRTWTLNLSACPMCEKRDLHERLTAERAAANADVAALLEETARHRRFWTELLNNSLMSEDAKCYARKALRIKA